MRPARHGHRRGGAGREPPRADTFDRRRGRQRLAAAVQLEPQVGPGLPLDPPDAPADREGVGEPEPPTPALDDLAAAPAVRVEPTAEVRQLWFVGVSGDVAGEAVTDEPAGPSARGVVL